jgi:hypothetical protein
MVTASILYLGFSVTRLSIVRTVSAHKMSAGFSSEGTMALILALATAITLADGVVAVIIDSLMVLGWQVNEKPV